MFIKLVMGVHKKLTPCLDLRFDELRSLHLSALFYLSDFLLPVSKSGASSHWSEAMLKAVMLRYTVEFFIITIGLFIIVFGLFMADINMPNLGYLVVILAAHDAGKFYFRKTGKLPEDWEKLKLSFLMILIQSVMIIPVIIFIFFEIPKMININFVFALISTFLFFGTFYVVINYFMIGMGAKMELKRFGRAVH